MDISELTPRIRRAKELLQTVRHAALATVNVDGSPHNSPVFAGFDDAICMYWSSHPEAQHSQNIARTGQVFIVLFDSLEKGGGLYVQATATSVPEAEMIEKLASYNAARRRLLKEEVPLAAFADGEQLLYCAVPQKMWVNMAERNEQGVIIRDHRYQISLQDLQ